MFDNSIDRFGSAAFADTFMIARAGLFQKTGDSFFCGFSESGRALFFGGMGGILLCAGARGGKLRDILAYNLCAGTLSGQSLLILDPKGEGAYISQDQTPDQKFCAYWNPAGTHGMIQHRINPVDYIRIDSPSLVSDVKVFCGNMIPESGSVQSQYFERRAQEYLEAIILALVRINGVLTLPDLYRAINLIPGNSDEWLNFAFEMTQSGFPIAVRIEEEIAAARENPTGGFQGILGEMFKAFAALSDPALLASVSPHPDGRYDFSLAQLCESDRRYQFYMMPPAEFIEAWSPVIKALFVAAMIYKSRSPSAPRQTWILDEAALLQKFPLAVKLYTYGAGIGIRPCCVFQSTFQMNALGPAAENIITSSAALRIYFAIRDIESAANVSRALGAQTLEFDDAHAQARAQFARQQAMERLIAGGDPMTAGIEYAHHAREEVRKTKQHRLLRTPDEVLNTPSNRSYTFADILEHAIYGLRKAYFEQKFMAGRYFSNPYYPPLDSVRVKTTLGHARRSIISEPVPERFAHYPQYQDGYWRRVES